MNWIAFVACGLCSFIFLSASYLAWHPDEYDEDRRRSLTAVIAPMIPGAIFAAGAVNLLIELLLK